MGVAASLIESALRTNGNHELVAPRWSVSAWSACLHVSPGASGPSHGRFPVHAPATSCFFAPNASPTLRLLPHLQ